MNYNALNCESHRKPRRRRHRNKSRNSNIRKKRLKKFHFKSKSETVKTNVSKLDSVNDCSKMTSNWYWSNYRKALEWQEKHKTAHWKACTLALLEENRHLLQIINQLNPGIHPAVTLTQNYANKGHFSAQNSYSNQSNSNMYSSANDTYKIEKDEYEDLDDDYDDDGDDDENKTDGIEFEMSEEMLKFFEQSYKHKMEMKEQKEKESLQKTENKIKELQTNKMKRSTEMNLLYGDGASMIIGMETAVQLSFEKYCDTKSPKYWPNIPFRL